MGVTSQGIYYPDPSGPPRRQDLQDLAESVDVAIAPVIETAVSLGLTVAADWTLTAFSAARIGIIRVFQAALTYSGATITAGSTGNITDTLVLSDIPVEWRPSIPVIVGFSRGGQADGIGAVTSDGTFLIQTLSPTATIVSGNGIVLNATYLVPA